MTDQARRKVLKTLAYGAVLSTGVASTVVMASSTQHAISVSSTNDVTQAVSGLSDSSGVTIFQQGSGTEQSVALMNLTDKPIYLHELAPISVENIDGSQRVKVNTASSTSGLVLKAGQRVSFELSAPSPELASISSEHAGFNGSVLFS